MNLIFKSLMTATGAISLSLALSNSASAFDFTFTVSGYQTAVQPSPGSSPNPPLPEAGVFSGIFSTIFADSTTPVTNVSQLTAFSGNWSGSSVDSRFLPFSITLDQVNGFSFDPATSSFGLLSDFVDTPNGDVQVVGLFLNALVGVVPPTFPPTSVSVIAQSPESVVVTAVPEPHEYLGTAATGLLLGGAFLRRRQLSRRKSTLDI
jgi:hypothetical protein